jgi:hypothetical protein
MAKRKNTAALFEVFHDTRSPASAASPMASVLSGIRSWFAARGGRAVTAASDPNDPTTMPMKSPLIAPRQAPVEAAASAPAPAPQPAAPRMDAASDAVQTPAHASDQSSPASAAASNAPADFRSQPTRHSHFRFDGARRELTLRLRLNTAAVTCFGILLTVALAYVLGRRAGTRPAVLAAAQQTDARGTEIRPAALDIPRHVAHAPAAGAGATGIKPPRLVDARDHEKPMANVPHGLPPAAPPISPSAPAVGGKRIVGLNYYIIQDSPSEAGAIDARDFFVKNGIPCTAEKMPPGFNQNLYAVISAQGFEHLSGPECDALKRQVVKVQGLYSPNNRNKRFSPVAFKQK